MYKQIFAVILLSLLAALALSYFSQVLQWLVGFQAYIARLLSVVFSTGSVGKIVAKWVSYFVIPFGIGIIVALLGSVVRSRFIPPFIPTVWVVWLIQMTALAA